jgi:tRNA (guanosine-2'-O-)-methyltransferase
VALLLEDVQTPFNVGAIVRTAAAYRVEHLWLAGSTASLSHPGTRKTALGSERYVRWSVAPSGPDAVAAAHREGYAVVGVELAAGARPLHELVLGDAVCLALGHEDRGLSSGLLSSVDSVGFLPQVGRVGSLNVAVAAAIALYETRRQEWTQPVEPPT